MHGTSHLVVQVDELDGLTPCLTCVDERCPWKRALTSGIRRVSGGEDWPAACSRGAGTETRGQGSMTTHTAPLSGTFRAMWRDRLGSPWQAVP